MRWLGSSGLALPSIMVGLLSLEIGCRLMLGPPALRHWQNFVLKARLEARNRKNAQRDSAYRGRPLGVPTPGAARSLPSAWDVPASAAGERRVARTTAEAVANEIGRAQRAP
jgi:hypothetical protein